MIFANFTGLYNEFSVNSDIAKHPKEFIPKSLKNNCSWMDSGLSMFGLRSPLFNILYTEYLFKRIKIENCMFKNIFAYSLGQN